MPLSQGRRHGSSSSELQPCNHYDRQRYRGQSLHRAAYCRSCRTAHPQGETGQRSSDSWRTGRSEPCNGTGRKRVPQGTQCAPDRYHCRDHQEGRGPSGIQGHHGKDWRAGRSFQGRNNRRRWCRIYQNHRLSGRSPSCLHPWRKRRRYCQQRI